MITRWELVFNNKWTRKARFSLLGERSGIWPALSVIEPALLISDSWVILDLNKQTSLQYSSMLISSIFRMALQDCRHRGAEQLKPGVQGPQSARVTLRKGFDHV